MPSQGRHPGEHGAVAGICGHTSDLLGDGGRATQATLHKPMGITVDADGAIVIADTGNRRIRKVTPDGIIRTVAGNGLRLLGGTTGSAAPLP